MPELTEVQTPKTAGFVDRGYNYERRKKRMEEEEAEIARLEALARGEETQEEESDSKVATDEQVQATSDSQQEETQESAEAQEEDVSLSGEEKSFKKRYGDLRRHMQQKEKEWESKLSDLEKRISGEKAIRPPKSDEDIEAWAKQYPDVAGIVETIAAQKAQEMFSKAEKRLQDLDNAQIEMERTKAENAIRKSHADFDDLRSSDEFHDWANEQPKWVQDALYENADDPKSVIRVIDLYKADMNLTPADKKANAKAAASVVSKGSKTKVDAEGSSGQFRESEVNAMSATEYEAKEEDIMKAMRSGKFIYDVSGSAR